MGRARRGSPIAALVTAAAVTAASQRVLAAVATSPRWARTNFRGRTVSLHGGASAAVGVLAGALVGGETVGPGAVAAAVGTATVAGGYDDFLAGRNERVGDKGWRGHLRALGQGRVSGGVLKVVVIGAGAAVAARSTAPTRPGRVVSAALIAGTANLVNLFDLRPGRADKALLAVSPLLLGGRSGGSSRSGGLAAAVIGAAAAELPGDLAERRMLGDLGANPLGAVLGLRLAAGGPWTRGIGLVVVLGLTVASERVSFSRVIAATPLLRRVDEWGRIAPVERPPAPPIP